MNPTLLCMSLLVGLNIIMGVSSGKTDPEPYTDADDTELSGESYLKKMETEAGEKLMSEEISTDPDPYTEENETGATQNPSKVTKYLHSEETTEASQILGSEETETGPKTYIKKLKPKEDEESQKPKKSRKPLKPKKTKTEAVEKMTSKETSIVASPDPDPYTEENETEATQNLESQEKESGPDPYTEVTEKLESEVTTETSKKQESEETETGPNPYIEKPKPKETHSEDPQKPQEPLKPQKPRQPRMPFRHPRQPRLPRNNWNPRMAEIETDPNTKDSENVKSEVDHLNCTISDYFCNPTAAALIERVDDHVVKSAEECQFICQLQKKCKFFSFFKFRGTPSCYLLRSCNEKKPMCTIAGACLSGQKDCQDNVACPKLKLTKGDNSRWRCDGINPYKEDIPSHVACYTSCPLWANAAGKKVTAKSTCQKDGMWSNPVAFPPGPLSYPAVLNKPDGPDMKCGGCKPLNLTYNPNEEKGTGFHCNPPLDWDTLPVKIDEMTQCDLLCDRMLVASVECKDGKWTGQPEVGFWCTKRKPSVNNWIQHQPKSKEEGKSGSTTNTKEEEKVISTTETSRTSPKQEESTVSKHSKRPEELDDGSYQMSAYMFGGGYDGYGKE